MTEIVIRDSNEVAQGILQKYSKATFVPRWNGAGTFQIELPLGRNPEPTAKLLKPGAGINCVLSDGKPFSGFLTEYHYEFDSQAGEKLTVVGMEDKAMLGFRLILPTPAAGWNGQGLTYKVSGPAETVAKQLVRVNITPEAVSPRGVADLYCAPSKGRGPTVAKAYRYDNLLEALQKLLSPYGMGFTLVRTSDLWTFDVQMPILKSQDIVFSREIGNIQKMNVDNVIPGATRIIAGGMGVGASRNITAFNGPTGATSAAWGNMMIEQFMDSRNTSDPAETQQSANEQFAQTGEQFGVSMIGMDTEDNKFGRDYGLGTQVTIEADGVSYGDVVSAAVYDIDPNQGTTISPVVGNADQVFGRKIKINNVVRALQSRLALIERSQ